MSALEITRLFQVVAGNGLAYFASFILRHEVLDLVTIVRLLLILILHLLGFVLLLFEFCSASSTAISGAGGSLQGFLRVTVAIIFGTGPASSHLINVLLSC